MCSSTCSWAVDEEQQSYVKVRRMVFFLFLLNTPLLLFSHLLTPLFLLSEHCITIPPPQIQPQERAPFTLNPSSRLPFLFFTVVMATSALVPTKRDRGSNWEAEYYRNGYPQEIIVIEDSPPPTPHDRPQSSSQYTVVQAPTPPPSMPSYTSSSHARISHYQQQQLQYQTTSYPSLYHPAYQQQRPPKRQRHYTPAPSMQQQQQHHMQYPFDTSYYHTNNKRRRKELHPPPSLLPQPTNDADGHFIVRRGHFLKNRCKSS